MPETETVLVVKRGEGCECPVSIEDKGKWELFGWAGPGSHFMPICPHGSTVEVLGLRVVECEECGGSGSIADGELPFWPFETAWKQCPDCLGTGYRLAKSEETADAH